MLARKADRFQEFLRRLADGPALVDQGSARRFIEATLNAVEDALSGVPFNPGAWRTDGWMYPVQDDHAADADGHPGVLALRSRGHETFIGPNGAIEIHDLRADKIVFAKLGADGKGVWS